jgi:hypothetical protein
MPRFRTLKQVDVEVHPLVSFIMIKMEEQRIPYAEMCTKAKLGERTLRRWRMGQTTPAIDDIERALNALGYSLDVIRVHKGDEE